MTRPTDQSIHQKIRSLIDNLSNLKDEKGEFLEHLPDGRIIDTKSWDTDTWNWTHGIGLWGIWMYSQQCQDESILNLVTSWFEMRFASGVKVDKNINTMAPFLTLAYLYEKTGDRSYLPHLEEWAQWVMVGLNRTKYGGMQHDTYQGPNPEQLWDDTLMMTVMPLAKIGILLGHAEYVQEAKRQFLLHIKYLFDRRTGAFFHGWVFEGNHNFAEARWARGNSWLTIALPDFIEMLDRADRSVGGWGLHDPIRQHLLDTLEAQLEFLLGCQDSETGMWHTLLDHNDERSYLEASATAGFAYGMLKAAKFGLFQASANRYIIAASAAVESLLVNIDEKGELQNVSFGTGMGKDLDFYREIPKTSMPYGQAMAIMALGEYVHPR